MMISDLFTMWEWLFAIAMLSALSLFIKNKKLKRENFSLQVEVATFKKSEQLLQERFKAISYDSLEQNSQNFLSLAGATMAPFQEAMLKFDTYLMDLEKNRSSAYRSLTDQVTQLLEAQTHLRLETKNLSAALKAPPVRGKWGEMQLRRVVEMSGMQAHCDFYEQGTVHDDTGARLRPDMVISLPSEKQIIVDAKAPLSAYFESLETQDEGVRTLKLKEHAKQVRSHIQQLSKKSYREQFTNTPEFVILFIPGEAFFSAALEADPSLLEAGIEDQVILATPTTLLALLRSCALAFRQEKLSKHAEEISQLGSTLYTRLQLFVEHFNKVGQELSRAGDSYNKAVASFEKRVLVTARKFKEMQHKLDSDSLDKVQGVDKLLSSIEAE